MVERLFLGGITLQSCYVTPRNPQLSTRVETDLAYPAPTISNQAAMSTGETAHIPIRESCVKLPGDGHRIEHFSQGCHEIIANYITRPQSIGSEGKM
jgi:hypothetical protein